MMFNDKKLCLDDLIAILGILDCETELLDFVPKFIR